MTCDVCRSCARGVTLTGYPCGECAAALGPEAESLAAELLGRLDLTVPEDLGLWGALLELLAELVLLRKLPAGRLLLAGLRDLDRRPGPTRGPAAKPRPKGRPHA